MKYRYYTYKKLKVQYIKRSCRKRKKKTKMSIPVYTSKDSINAVQKYFLHCRQHKESRLHPYDLRILHR